MLKKICYIRDRKVISSSLVEFLYTYKLQVYTTTKKSKNLLSDLYSYKPDLVILDLAVGNDVFCFELMEKLKVKHEVPFVIYTNSLIGSNIDKYLNSGIYGIISHSISNEEFLFNVKLALTRFYNDRKNKYDKLFLKEANGVSNIGHWRFDVKNNKLKWSDETYKIFEKDKSLTEITNEEFIESIHPEDRDKVNKAYINSLHDKKPYKIEHRIIVNGKIKHVIEKCETFFYDNQPILSVGTVEDITERIKSELKLKKSEESFKEIFQDYPDETCLINPHYLAVLEDNYTAAKKLGYLNSEIANKKFNEILKSKNNYHILLKSLEALNLGESFVGEGVQIKNKIEREFTRKQIELENLNANLNRLVDERTKKLQIEINERKKAQELQQRFFNVIEQSSDFVMIANIEGIIEYVNPALCEFTLYNNKEIIGKKPSLFKSDMYDDSYYKELWSTISKGKIFSDEFVNKKKNGDLYSIAQVILPLKNLDGKITHFASVSRDFTEKRKLEKRIIEIQEDERSRISRELHDDIGQSVTAIKLSLSRIIEKYKLPEEEFVEIKDMIKSLMASVREISYNLMPSVLNDYGLVSAVNKMVQQVNVNTLIDIDFSYNSENKRLPSDLELSLFRIIQESLNNAITYSGATEIRIYLKCLDGTVFLDIKDNGNGFDHKNKSDGQGVRNMKHRANLMNGIFQLHSGKKGTHIKVRVPFKNCTT